APAVQFGDQTLSYAELNRRANQLAHYLQRRGVGPEVPVALCLDRSLELVVAVLGILKAGGAYVPLDPTSPPDRLAFLLTDTAAPVLLTQQHLLSRFAHIDALGDRPEAICLDADWPAIAHEPDHNPQVEVEPEHLAYIIYTSGSTGKPKGVMIQHGSLAHYNRSAHLVYGLEPKDRALQFASISFDASAEEIFPTLTSGATLVLRTDALMESVPHLIQAVRDWELTVLNFPTAYWHELVATMGRTNIALPACVRLVIIGGERAMPERVAQWLQQIGHGVQLINSYGPTEGTVVATVCDLSTRDDMESLAGEVPIGEPLAHVSSYILDADGQPVPIGSAGELHIGGLGLARGYLRRPELTAEKFIPDRFSDTSGSRLYKTGDLVRQTPDGSIEFLRRVDRQVKLRGFRIELGEIEAALAQHPDVAQAVVIVRDETRGEKRLVAYVTKEQKNKRTKEQENLEASGEPGSRTTGGHPALGSQLREFLAQRLPAYMIPSAFVQIEQFPRTASGKIDWRQLPAPGRVDREVPLVAPRTALEQALAQIWAEVFGLKQVGIEHNFFELGGHSLAAMQVLARLREQLDQDLTLSILFKAPTIALLAQALERGDRGPAQPQTLAIRRIPHDVPLPLSFSQERVCFLQQLDPTSVAYHAYALVDFKGQLSHRLLEQALTEVVRRHEILHTTFHHDQGIFTQSVRSPYPVTVPVLDLRTIAAELRAAEAERLIVEECQRPFDIARLPLVRWTLLQLADDEYILVQVEHHLLHDGWSLARLLYEIKTLYTAFFHGQPSPLPQLDIQYADFAAWQHEWVKSPMAQRQIAYWKQRLAGSAAILELPTDRPRPATQTFRGDVHRVQIPALVGEQLAAFSHQHGATLFMTMLAAFKALLYRYTGQTDLLVGSAIANRRLRDAEEVIGMIVNNVVLRTEVTDALSFQELLIRVRDTVLEDYEYQDLPFEKVVEAVQPERDLSYNPLFQVMFSFHDSPMPHMDLPEVAGTIRYPHNRSAKFDLNIVVMPQADQGRLQQGLERDSQIMMEWEYNTDLFDHGTIARMIEHYQTLLLGAIAAPEQPLWRLPLLTDKERSELLSWNDAPFVDHQQTLIHQLVEAQVAATPDAVAVICGAEQITYRELDRRADQLARRLRSLGVGPEVRVGLCLERSPDLVVSLLGVLKAGGAYVPLDPSYPAQRLQFMLDDAQAAVVVTHQSVLERLPQLADPQQRRRVLCIDAAWDEPGSRASDTFDSAAAPHNLAYIIYTSGSTGQPKGVQLPHRAVVNFLTAMQRRLDVGPRDVLLAVTTISFDIAVLELFLPLTVGARIVIANAAQVIDGAQVASLLAEHHVTVMQATPATWQMLLAAGWSGSEQLRILCGGEALTPDLAAQLQSRGAVLWNLYGPTETAIWSAIGQVGGAMPVSVGQPIDNTQIYMLDSHLQLLPVGIPGEVYIGGDGVARGYLNHPQLTAAQFIPHSFSHSSGERLYRTGDRGYYRSDRQITILGRVDQQVKLRGFRIELGEIEALINQHPAVHTSAVVVRADDPQDKRLVAYIVPADAAPADAATTIAAQVRSFLQTKLPDYMLPSTVVLLDTLPLTANGKIDRRALPAPDWSGEDLAVYVAPRNPVEEITVEIWAAVLKLERIGVHDDFFKLGGHSLLAGQVMARVRQTFQVELPIRSLFEARTVAAFAEVVTEALLAEIESLPDT
ncbi:MAG TPA: amino acid adenylation domain-containing protein, partial [Herpetosiphonaceae bacterium]